MVKRCWKACLIGIVVAMWVGCSQDRPTQYEGWELVWHDEFDKD